MGALSVQYRSADTIEDGERHAHWAQCGISYVTKTSFRLADAGLFQNKNYDGGRDSRCTGRVEGVSHRQTGEGADGPGGLVERRGRRA